MSGWHRAERPPQARSVAGSGVGRRDMGREEAECYTAEREVCYSSHMPQRQPNRKRPTMSISIDPEVHERVKRLTATLPGASVSGVVNEALSMSLPMMEKVAESMHAARTATGETDYEKANRLVAEWIVGQVMDNDVSDTDDEAEEKEVGS